ncbi:hypothetical protein LguiB_027210 [Lonicera macranthoides]
MRVNNKVPPRMKLLLQRTKLINNILKLLHISLDHDKNCELGILQNVQFTNVTDHKLTTNLHHKTYTNAIAFSALLVKQYGNKSRKKVSSGNWRSEEAAQIQARYDDTDRGQKARTRCTTSDESIFTMSRMHPLASKAFIPAFRAIIQQTKENYELHCSVESPKPASLIITYERLILGQFGTSNRCQNQR